MAKKVRNCAIWGPRIHHHPMAASLVNGGGSFCSAAYEQARRGDSAGFLLAQKVPKCAKSMQSNAIAC